jgi:uncharacterized membrane protein YhhN
VTAYLAVVTGLLVLVVLVAERAGHPGRGAVKAAASTGFLGIAIASGAFDTGYGRWVLAALCLSWVGDVALVSAARRWFLVGLAAFLLGHLAYVGGFAVAGVSRAGAAIAAAALCLPAALVGRWLWPHLAAGMRGPVAAYIAVISAMVAAAVGGVLGEVPAAALPAAVAFYVSDVFVARDRFVAPGFVNRVAGLPLYYGAQIVFALSVGGV